MYFNCSVSEVFCSGTEMQVAVCSPLEFKLISPMGDHSPVFVHTVSEVVGMP